MLAVVSRTAPALVTVALLIGVTSTASAQYYDPCAACAAQSAAVVTPVVVAASPGPVLQPVTETLYQNVPVTSYHPVQHTVQKPVVRTAYEDRTVTAYRQVWDTRVAEVPTVSYQNVTEMRPVVQNRSYWQTAWQTVPKVHPLQYDPTPTLAGAINRMGYQMRMAFTPDYVAQRQFVPNMVTYNVPVQRTVAVPGTKQVTYNVARMEPYTTTQKVAVQKVEYVESVVTAYEPVTEMRTMAVGTTTRYAFVDPTGGRTASGPTPATANGQTVPQREADAGENRDSSAPRSSQSNEDMFNNINPISYPQPRQAAPQPRTYLDTRAATDDQAAGVATVTPAAAPTAVRVAGWRPSRDAVAAEGPKLSVAAN